MSYSRIEESTLHLLSAAEDGDSERLKKVIDDGVDVNGSDELGKTALHLAAVKGHRDIVQLLLEKEVDLDKLDHLGYTALNYAARGGYRGIVEDLIEKKAKLDVQSFTGNSAVHAAARNGHDDLMLMLIENGADVHLRNSKRQTVLHDAAFGCKQGSTIEKLLSLGLLVNDQDVDGKTALHCAAEQENWATIPTLIENGASNIGDNIGNTPLYLVYAMADSSPLRTANLKRYLYYQHKQAEANAPSPPAEKNGTEQPEEVPLKRFDETDWTVSEDEQFSTTAEIMAKAEKKFHKEGRPDDKVKNQEKNVMKECVWKNLGAREVSQDVLSNLSSTEDNFTFLTDSALLNFLFSYFLNLTFDLWRAQDATWAENDKWIPWLFRGIIIAPSIVFLINYIPERKRKSDLRLMLPNEMDQQALYDPKLSGRWFLKFYNSLPLAILAAVFQLWPIITFCHRKVVANFVDEMKQKKSKRAAFFDIHNKALDVQIELIEYWGFVEFTSNLTIWLYTTNPNDFFSFLIFFKIYVKTSSIICYLFDEENGHKFPVRILERGKVLLILCFLFRVLSRMFCLAESFRAFGYYVFFAYPVHVLMMAAVSCLDGALHHRSCCAGNFGSVCTVPRILHFLLGLYNYIPPKVFNQTRSLPGRRIYLLVIMLQDAAAVASLYFLKENHDFLLGTYFWLFVVCCWIISVLFLILYYRYGHPWSWKLHVLPI